MASTTIEDLIIPRQLALFAGTVNAMADYGMIRGMVFPRRDRWCRCVCRPIPR